MIVKGDGYHPLGLSQLKAKLIEAERMLKMLGYDAEAQLAARWVTWIHEELVAIESEDPPF